MTHEFNPIEIEAEVMLPQTPEDLDTFVASIIEEFSLPPGDDTYDAMATVIMHLPSTRAYAPKSYFASCVRKSLANRAAYTRLRELAQKREDAAKVAEDEAKAKLTLVENHDGSQPLQGA